MRGGVSNRVPKMCAEEQTPNWTHWGTSYCAAQTRQSVASYLVFMCGLCVVWLEVLCVEN